MPKFIRILTISAILLGAYLFIFSGRVKATCDDPTCHLVQDFEICKSKSSTNTGCYTNYFGYHCLEQRISPVRTCDLTPWGYPGEEGYAFYAPCWWNSCDTCCTDGSGPETSNFNATIYASNTGAQRWTENCYTTSGNRCPATNTFGYNGVSLSCLTAGCSVWSGWDCTDGACGHANLTGESGIIELRLNRNPAYNSCKWYVTRFDLGNAPSGESGTDCTAVFNLPGNSDWQSGVHFMMQSCRFKSCSFSNASDNNISDGINDWWCIANDYQGCQFSRSGTQTVNGQVNPGFWEGAIPRANESSVLWGEREVYVDNVNNYQIEARVRVDDRAEVFVEKVGAPLVSVSAASPVNLDACTACAAGVGCNSNCQDAWVRYQVTLPQDGDYIMNVNLKHDRGCESDQLFYRFYFGSDFYTYSAIRGNDSWEWAMIDIGTRTAGTHNFGFALGHDCPAPDLNAYVYNTTIRGILVNGFTFNRYIPEISPRWNTTGPSWSGNYAGQWTNYVDITSQFQTGWNIVRFMAEDTWSPSRFFDFDLNVSANPAPVCTTSNPPGTSPQIIAACESPNPMSVSGTDSDFDAFGGGESIAVNWGVTSGTFLPGSCAGVSGAFSCSSVGWTPPTGLTGIFNNTYLHNPSVTDSTARTDTCPSIGFTVVNNLPSANLGAADPVNIYSGQLINSLAIAGVHPSPDSACDYLDNTVGPGVTLLNITCLGTPTVYDLAANYCGRSVLNDTCDFSSFIAPTLPVNVAYADCTVAVRVTDQFGASQAVVLPLPLRINNFAMTVSGTVYDKTVDACTDDNFFIEGVSVVLTSPGGCIGTTRTAAANSLGQYSFSGVPYCPGLNYTLALDLTGSWSSFSHSGCPGLDPGYNVPADGLSNLNFGITYLPANGWYQLEGGGSVYSPCESGFCSVGGIGFAPPLDGYGYNFYGSSQNPVNYIAQYAPFDSLVISQAASFNFNPISQVGVPPWLVEGYQNESFFGVSTFSSFYDHYYALLAPSDNRTINEINNDTPVDPNTVVNITPSGGTLNVSVSSNSFNNKQAVFLVDGDLNFSLEFNPSGSSYLFIVSGNVTVSPSVGGTLNNINQSAHIEAAILADGTFSTGTNGSADDQLKIKGVAAALGVGGFSFERDLGSSPTGINNSRPAELFSYSPRYLLSSFLINQGSNRYASWKEL